MSKIAVIGAGAWGTATAQSLSTVNSDISIWAYEKEVCDEINNLHMNSRYLYGVPLSKNIRSSTVLKDVLKDSEYVFYVTPSFALKEIMSKSKEFIREDAVPVVLTKGFIKEDGKDLPQLALDIANRELPKSMEGSGVYLSGPSHAEEVGRFMYTGLIAASKNKKNAIKVRDIVTNDHLSVYVSFDPIGAQVSAALKNVVAIAFGLADAMSEYNKNIGDNAFALIMSTGLNEIQTVGRSLGATHPETFTSISSVGDLYVTCASKHGRNRRFGRDLFQRKLYREWSNFSDLKNKLDIVGYLPEGIFAVEHAIEIKNQLNLKLPVISTVYQILNRDINPEESIGMLMKAVNKA